MVQLIHLVEQRDVFQQRYLMRFQRGSDLVDIGFGFVVFGAHRRDFVGSALENGQEAFFFFGNVEVFQLGDYAGQHLADFAEVLGADGIECLFRKIGDFLLRSRAVLQDHAGIAQLDFFGKFIDDFPLGFRQRLLVKRRDGRCVRREGRAFLYCGFGFGLDRVGDRIQS